MEINHTKIPREELMVFDQLKQLNVIFDVGSRSDADYLDLRPKAELHAFEPNPVFFDQLKYTVGDRKAYLNNFGLGDVTGRYEYVDGIQGFTGGEARPEFGLVKKEDGYEIRTLDEYVKKHKIKRIDFLKIDTEGFDYRVLLGGKKTLKKTRFIQYEHWDNKIQFHGLLEEDFQMCYIGYRNVLCMNKKIVSPTARRKIASYIEIHGFEFLI